MRNWLSCMKALAMWPYPKYYARGGDIITPQNKVEFNNSLNIDYTFELAEEINVTDPKQNDGTNE